jgi:hypothetical protein
LVYFEYYDYHDTEGIHIDIFFIGQDRAFLLVRSHRHKLLWVFNVGPSYTAVDIRQCISEVLGDYRYADVQISFVRSDGDVRFKPMKQWLQTLGLRYYMSPPDIHASRIERSIRILKEICRTILHSLEFLMPDQYYPYLVQEAVRLINTRYASKLGMSPRESFFHEHLNYKHQFSFHFGEVISYPRVKTSNSVKKSRVSYGVILGVDISSGNLIVENLVNKKEERVVNFKSRIVIDDSIRLYFKNYNTLSGLRYSSEHSIYLSCQTFTESQRSPYIPFNPQELLTKDLQFRSKELADRLEFLCSTDFYRCNALWSDHSVNDSRLATGFDHHTPLVDEGLSRQVHFDVLETPVNSNRGVAHNAHSDQMNGSSSTNMSTEFSEQDDVSISVPKFPLSPPVVVANTAVSDLETSERITLSVLQSAGVQIEPSIIEETLGNGKSPIEIRELNIHHQNLNSNLPINVIQMSYDKMKKLHPSETYTKGVSEYKTLTERGTIVGVHKFSIPKNSKLYYIFTSYVEKFKAGVFERVKSRSLFGGNEMTDDYSIRWDEVSARTISSSSLYTIVALMAKHKMFTGVMDFQSAFLNAFLPDKDQCFAKISKADSKLLVAADPEYWTPFVNPHDQCIYVKVVGALYGHPLSAALWYNFLKDKLALTGFVPLLADKCIFTRRYPDATLDIVGLWVDDLTMGSLNSYFFDEMRSFLRTHFRGEGTMEVGSQLEYLNLTFLFDNTDGSVTISQAHYWQKVCSKFKLLESDTSRCPHKSKFMERLRERGQNDDQITDTSEPKRLQFLSLVMSMLWGALRSFPDILFNLTALATRSKFGNDVDYSDALQVLKYINSCKENSIRLKINGNIRIVAFVDSSSNIHPDMRGHGGYVISLGDECYGGPVEVSSSRAKLNGRSVMDYELYSLHHMLPGIVFLHELLEELGFPQQPAIIFEDNRALIDLLRRGKISTGVTRHIAAKYYYAKDLILRKIIDIRHCPTLLMIADILTKDLDCPHFQKLSSRLRNLKDQDPSLSDDTYRKLYASCLDTSHMDEEEIKAIEVITNIIQSIIQS